KKMACPLMYLYGEATVTPTTATISTVNTKGKKEVTILLTSDGNVLKDEMGSKFFQFLFHHAECLFGNTIQVDWRKQANSKKDELFEDVIKEFGNPSFNKDFIMDYARKFIHSKRDKIRSKLTNDLRYPRPAWITNQTTWDELIKDAKFKRKSFKNPNYMPSAQEGGKRRLRDTTKATQARLSSIGSHKLGSGGYNSIRGSLVHQFRKEASDEDLKYALMHGSQGLRQHMIDRGEKLVIEHESECPGINIFVYHGAHTFNQYGIPSIGNPTDVVMVITEHILVTSIMIRWKLSNKSNRECSYYMWRQRFPVKAENRVEGREEVDNWVMTLTFPHEERVTTTRNKVSAGIYAFLPTEMVTGFPFIIQVEFLLVSSRKSIRWDDKWNKGILDCIPSDFCSAFLYLVKSVESAPLSSRSYYFDKYLPIYPPLYAQLAGVWDGIQE
ncbi:hypothetical protein KI387_006112, partial [Taxus chinensis]